MSLQANDASDPGSLPVEKTGLTCATGRYMLLLVPGASLDFASLNWLFIMVSKTGECLVRTILWRAQKILVRISPEFNDSLVKQS